MSKNPKTPKNHKKNSERSPVISNRKAFRDFSIEKTFEAGIELLGNEVKSLREANGNLAGSFARVEKNQVFLYNMHINPYKYSREEYDPLRVRKLLLNRDEIRYIEVKTKEKSFTLIPLKVYFKRGFAKVEIGLAKGKKFFDKREALKEKQVRRETERELYRKR